MAQTTTHRWCVKITDLPKNVSILDISKHFDVVKDRVIIPNEQPDQNGCYAWIIKFDNEQKARTFVSQWNKMYYSKHRIKCKVTENFDIELINSSSSVWHTESNYSRDRQLKRNYHSQNPSVATNNERISNKYVQRNSTGKDYEHRRYSMRSHNEKRSQRSSTSPPRKVARQSSVNDSLRQNSIDNEMQCDDIGSVNTEVLGNAYSDRQKLRSLEQRMKERMRANLPIFNSCTEFCRRLKTERVLIVRAETSSGKSTQLPQYAAEYFRDGLIVCTQPRAVAAMSLARRVANEYDGESEGHSVGYRIRGGHERNTYVSGTRIMFMTDAALIRETQFDPNLSKVRVLIVDEAHDRTLNTDVVLGIAKSLLKKRSQDFFVVVSSATIDPTQFLQFFDCSLSQLLTVPGRLYNVSEEYLPPPSNCSNQNLIEKHVVPTLRRLYPKFEGHTLVFLQGQRDIEQALKFFSHDIPKDCVALPLYGSMSLEEQDKVLNFDDENGKRRMVVFCTNVAETSLTINNVRLVIDSGLAKEARFDIKRRLTVIETVQISSSSAQQRKGRAGRTINGHCVRLYNKNDFKREHIEPEILRSFLDLTILQILRLGLDPKTFPFLDQPDLNLITNTFDLLTRLSCVDGNKTLTMRGKLFSELSLDPRFSALMAKAYTGIGGKYLLTRTATIVAILSAPGSLFYMGGVTKETKDEARALVALSAHQYDSDLFHLCDVYQRWKETGTIDQIAKKCLRCDKSVSKYFDACKTCRAQYANRNGLNNKILQIIDNSVLFYIQTITNLKWKLAVGRDISSTDNERDIIGKYLYELFPEHLGHLLVCHLPAAGVRLINSNICAQITNTSVFMQRLHDHGHQYFVSMSITQLPAGDYLVDVLHPVPSQDLNSVPICIVFSEKNIGWLVNCKIRQKFNEYRKQPWYKWVVYEYDQTICQLNIWGMDSDEPTVKPILQSILEKVRSELLEKTQRLHCGPICASFKSGLICTNIEKIDDQLRLDLQHVPCDTIDELYYWLQRKFDIHRQDIKKNNFLPSHRRTGRNNNVEYEALPFDIIFNSIEAFQRASERIPSYYIHPKNSVLFSSTTRTYMNTKNMWGRQLTISTRPKSHVISAEQVADTFSSYIVDCRECGKKIRQSQSSICLSDIPLDTDETFIRNAIRPIHPVKVSLERGNIDDTGSSSARIFFVSEKEKQDACNILRSGLCQQRIKIQIRHPKTRMLQATTILPKIRNVESKSTSSQTFRITAVNKDMALQLFENILPNKEPTWQVESSAIVTVLQPDIYPDFDQWMYNICKQFGTKVQQYDLERNAIRCVFSGASPPKTAAAAAMLAQLTRPLIIKISDYRQKYLFDELFRQKLIQMWSHELNLDIAGEEKDELHSTIEIRGPQIQQGQLMRKVADYSDEFDSRFHVYELNSKLANFFGPHKSASTKLDQLAQKWLEKDCYIVYMRKIKSIVIYCLPQISVTIADECLKELKQLISKITANNNCDESNRQCSFCGRTTTFRRFRICGHVYCHCTPTLLAQTLPLKCPDTNCKANIDITDLREIYKPYEITQLCKQSLQHYLLTHVDDRIFCPNNKCDGLVTSSKGYQTCVNCGERVCALCHIINDDLHEGRTCAERKSQVSKMGGFLQNLFLESERYVRKHWTPDLPPIINFKPNLHLIEKCLSLDRFYEGVKVLKNEPVPDLADGFFAFHGTDPTSIDAICTDGFDPRLRQRQLHGEGEYFGVTAAISHGYCNADTINGTRHMLVTFILYCTQVYTKVGFCHVVNNPKDWSYSYNLPVAIITYGNQPNTPPIINNTLPATRRTLPATTNTTSSSHATRTGWLGQCSIT
ncbi:hypothetical protein I4U23_021982 [Adineta vaga]|nr:hypothetical protein I4U23_021982 [Adineta vaga]